MLSSETLLSTVRIILLDPFSNGSSFDFACVCSHCCQKNHNQLTMSMKSPVSCVSDTFFVCGASFCLIYWNCYHLTNQILSMMSLTMMGMTLGPLVRALLPFTLMNMLILLETLLVKLMNLLVLFMAWGLVFFPDMNRVNW